MGICCGTTGSLTELMNRNQPVNGDERATQNGYHVFDLIIRLACAICIGYIKHPIKCCGIRQYHVKILYIQTHTHNFSSILLPLFTQF